VEKRWWRWTGGSKRKSGVATNHQFLAAVDD
jgi:hypothetical protein